MTRELLERKYPAGTRVKLIKARRQFCGVEEGTIGTVTGINWFDSIDVAWDGNSSNHDLIVGEDRFSVVYGR